MASFPAVKFLDGEPVLVVGEKDGDLLVARLALDTVAAGRLADRPDGEDADETDAANVPRRPR